MLVSVFPELFIFIILNVDFEKYVGNKNDNTDEINVDIN